MKSFVKELEWRGMIHDIMPGTEELLEKEMTTAYVGIDPTADSLHIGHLVSVMMLKHFQEAGHKPIVVIGGATGMIGDPSGKSKERNLLDEKLLRHNQESIKEQLKNFLDFDSNAENKALMLNNYDWMKDFSFLDFIRDIGKHLTVNYMMAKDSVKKRISAESKDGMSFTEFSYQLVQATDFLTLYKQHNCKLQMGGSDQWGNITSGTELIRRKTGGEAFALTCPLITKADGGKFGKTETGNIWLDSEKTSPYAFYQFWLNTSDEDAEKYIKIFTLLEKAEIESLIEEHKQTPHERKLQKTLAKELCIMVHSEEDYENAVKATTILFGKSSTAELQNIPEKLFLEIFEGVPQSHIPMNEIENGISIIDALAYDGNILKSKGEARRALKENAISLNKEKINENYMLQKTALINNKYFLIQRGKKNYFLILAQ
jgi:tyrosyl-tRNA synthetase